MTHKRKWRHLSHPRPPIKTVRGKQRQVEKAEIRMSFRTPESLQ